MFPRDVACWLCREEELHAIHEAKREYCSNCPMIRKMVDDEEKLRVRLLALQQEKIRILVETKNWAAISRIEQGAFYNFLKNPEHNDDRRVCCPCSWSCRAAVLPGRWL